MSEDNFDGPVGVFAWALYHMKQGRAVKRIGWLGYWRIETDKNQKMRDPNNWGDYSGDSPELDIVMHCKNGKIVNLSKGCDPLLTAENMAANDWMVLTDGQVAELDKVIASRCLA